MQVHWQIFFGSTVKPVCTQNLSGGPLPQELQNMLLGVRIICCTHPPSQLNNKISWTHYLSTHQTQTKIEPAASSSMGSVSAEVMSVWV